MLRTGVDRHRKGVGNTPETTPPGHEGRPGYHGVLAPDTVTLATLLRDQGWGALCQARRSSRGRATS